MKGMGPRTIKTAVGAGLAIWTAEMFQLEFPTFAGIIVIMCIEQTKKKTLHTISKKFFACILSLLFGSLFFEGLGYTPIILSLFIFFFIPVLMLFHIQGGFVTSMVVFTHIYTLKDTNLSIMLNEFYIILIGTGIAFLVNSIMPNSKKELEKFKESIERKFSKILYEFSAYLRDTDRKWDGKEIIELEDLIGQAKAVAIREVENHLMRRMYKDYYYLEMREHQLELLKRMLPTISALGPHLKQKEIFADYLEELSLQVHSGDTTDFLLANLAKTWSLIRETDLPVTRDEFETRAQLFYLMNEIENYLLIKKKLYTKDSSKTKKGIIPVK